MTTKASFTNNPFNELLSDVFTEEAHADEMYTRIPEALPFALELQAPPLELKDKILRAVRQHEVEASSAAYEAHREPSALTPKPAPVQLWKNWAGASAERGLLVQRSREGIWEKTGVDGVEVKQLYVDHKRDYVTMLVRMQPGSAYPSHRHGGFEECYVISGDLVVGDLVMTAGDYQRAEGGSVHVMQSTREGCLLYIVSSQHDELLA